MVLLGALALSACEDLLGDDTSSADTPSYTKYVSPDFDSDTPPDNLKDKVAEKLMWPIGADGELPELDMKVKEGDKLDLTKVPKNRLTDLRAGLSYEIYRGGYAAMVMATDGHYQHTNVLGYATPKSKLKSGGRAVYSGPAIGRSATTMPAIGDFTYEVDFGRKTGKGTIYGISYLVLDAEHRHNGRDIPYIDLESGRFADDKDELGNKVVAIKGSATASSRHEDRHHKYSLYFYGPNAENLVGHIEQNMGDGDILNTVGLFGIKH